MWTESAGVLVRRAAGLIAVLCCCGVVGAVPAVAEQRCAVLEVFLKGDSERSREAREYIEQTYGGRRGLSVSFRDVVEDQAALDRYWKLAGHFKVEKPGLPAYYVSSRFEYGWDGQVTPRRIEESLTVEVFVRQGCARCAAAKPIIFNQIAPNYPAYKFVEKDLVTSADARNRLNELSARYHVQAASVPALHLCGRLMVGYLDPQTSFKQWNDVLKGATVVCAAPKPPSSDKLSEVPAFWRLRHRRTVPDVWLSSAAWAEEPPAIPADEPTTVPSPVPPLLPELAAARVDDTSEPPPPPRRRSELPPEVPAESEPQRLPELPEPQQAGDYVDLPLLGQVHWRAWGMPAFTIAVGLIDGFNPCAMWVLLFLLSLLVNLRDRWKILAVSGTFVFISGLAYFLFMAGWLHVAQWFAHLRKAQIALGVLGVTVGAIHVKDFFAFKQGVSLSIPDSAKPKLYDRMRRIVHAETVWAALAGATVLAVLVNFIELLCTAGLPAMYTGILTMQQLPAWQNYLYLVLYIAAYMFDDSLMVCLVVVTLGKHKLQESGGRMLKLVSGVVILGLGLTMLLKPEWLA